MTTNQFRGRAEVGRANDTDTTPPPPVDLSRAQAVRVLYVDRLADPDPGVAALNIHITAAGLLHTTAAGLDPVHARLVLQEIERVADTLRQHLAKKPANVIPLR